ncbi:MAG: DUF1329 domain-containing protein [Gammaproteobacteria bacterium]|nr:DUF1329 domain-containing protein [Gammaproteobacteria bacterium]
MFDSHHQGGKSARHRTATPMLRGLALLFAAAGAGAAPLSSEEIAKLGYSGTELTPLGAIRAGNAEGTIPEWKYQPIPVPAGFKPGDHHPDPFADDQILFTITADNYQQHADKLTPGQIKLFEKIPGYKMNIYPSRRSAVYEKRFYDAAMANAKTAEIVVSGSQIGFKNAVIAWPFPIAKNGDEAIANALTRPLPTWINFWDNTAATTSGGSYEVNKLSVQIHWIYGDAKNTVENFDPSAPGTGYGYFQTITAPVKQAGQVLLAFDPITYTSNLRQAWQYNPGQRRVKRAPQINYAYPFPGSSGLMTVDSGYGYNGPNDRFEWTLEGLHEKYVPYNSYKLHSGDIKVSDIVKDGHLNQDLARYELHRVWKLTGKLREGTSHIYGYRELFLDEDSWWVSLADNYDMRGELWRPIELHLVNLYDAQTMFYTLLDSYDLQSGRMMFMGLDNEDPGPDLSWRADDSYFSPGNMRAQGTR